MVNECLIQYISHLLVYTKDEVQHEIQVRELNNKKYELISMGDSKPVMKMFEKQSLINLCGRSLVASTTRLGKSRTNKDQRLH